MCQMKHLLAAAAVLGAFAATINSATAQDYVSWSCSPPPPTAMYIYPTANWDPFFRHHWYRYGPIVVCSPSAVAATPVVSVKY
jgi:hypothetical protein